MAVSCGFARLGLAGEAGSPLPGRGWGGQRRGRASGTSERPARHRRRDERHEGGRHRSGRRDPRAGRTARRAPLSPSRLGRGGPRAVVGQRLLALPRAAGLGCRRDRRQRHGAGRHPARRAPAGRCDLRSSRTTRGQRSEVEELRAALGPTVLARTGSPVTQQSVGPTALWLARNEPEVWAATHTVLGSYDYVVLRLTGSRSRRAQLGARERPLRAGDGCVGRGHLRRRRNRSCPAPASAPRRRGRRRGDRRGGGGDRAPRRERPSSRARPTTSPRLSRPASSSAATC